ncbi:MAG: GAF domain-containing protein [Candidatus Angelobacter sp.]
MSARYKELLSRVQEAALSAQSAQALMQSISSLLHGEIARFNWVGFYVLSNTEPDVLVLGPFTGSFTPLQRVPLHQGLCGAAASLGKSVVVNDVVSDPRYVAGSQLVKSEMVTPVVAKGKIVAEIDVNSYFAATFGPDEQDLVSTCAAIVGKYMEQGI